MKRLCVVILVLVVAVSALAIAPTTEVAARKNNNVIVASFNIIHFNEYRQNMPRVAAVVQNFDLCGIVELETVAAMELLQAELKKQTGVKWKFIQNLAMQKGDKVERFAYIWRPDRVQLLGDASSSPVWYGWDVYSKKPLLAHWKSGDFDFITVLVHLAYFPPNKKAKEALRLQVDLNYLYTKQNEKDIILMGDFNINYNSSDLDDLNALPGIVKIEPQGVQTRVLKDGSMGDEAIDHIFTFKDTSEWTGESGAFNFVPVIYPNLEDRKKGFVEISDHLPVWAVFFTDRNDDD